MFNTIADLKQFSVQIKNTSNIDDLSVIILSLKGYIQQNNELQNIVKNKIDECNILKGTLKYKLLARYLCGELREVVTPKILKIERDMYLDWWNNINTNAPNGLAELYLIPKPTKKHFERYKKCKYITNYMCYPLFTFFNRFLEKYSSCLDIYMFYQDENTIYKTANQEFYLLYLKAVTNGTLNDLIKAINPNTHKNYKLKTTKKINKPKLTYNTDNQTFYINNDKFTLEPVECTCLAVYCGFTEQTLQADEKAARAGINSKWKNLNFSNENLIKKPRGKQVEINKNVIDIDY